MTEKITSSHTVNDGRIENSAANTAASNATERMVSEAFNEKKFAVLPLTTQMSAEKFAQLLEDNFHVFDKDQNSQITREEFHNAVGDKLASADVRTTGIIGLRRYEDFTRMNAKDGPYITREDAYRFRYNVDPTRGFNSDMWNARFLNYGMGTLDAVFCATAGSAAFVFGSIALADPEPATKLALGAMTVFAAGASATSGYATVARLALPSQIKREYNQQRAGLQKWDVFQQGTNR